MLSRKSIWVEEGFQLSKQTPTLPQESRENHTDRCSQGRNYLSTTRGREYLTVRGKQGSVPSSSFPGFLVQLSFTHLQFRVEEGARFSLDIYLFTETGPRTFSFLGWLESQSRWGQLQYFLSCLCFEFDISPFFRLLRINEVEKGRFFFPAIIIEMDQFLLFKDANPGEKWALKYLSYISRNELSFIDSFSNEKCWKS